MLIGCVLQVPGAELGISSDGFFDLPAQPKKCAVFGAGYIAVEMAGILNAMGTTTDLFCRGDKVGQFGLEHARMTVGFWYQVLRNDMVFDSDIVGTLCNEMAKHGPTLKPRSDVSSPLASSVHC